MATGAKALTTSPAPTMARTERRSDPLSFREVGSGDLGTGRWASKEVVELGKRVMGIDEVLELLQEGEDLPKETKRKTREKIKKRKKRKKRKKGMKGARER